MRIISGSFKGKKISLPKNKKTRPLRDLVKESIFNLLEHSNKFELTIQNSLILDLFSGTGSFGLECISRGAKEVTFIENYKEVLGVLRKNIENCNAEKESNIIEEDCFDHFNRFTIPSIKYDLIFIDPPFKEKKTNLLIEIIKKKNFLKQKGIIIVHRHSKDSIKITKHLKILDERNYGISKITFGF